MIEKWLTMQRIVFRETIGMILKQATKEAALIVLAAIVIGMAIYAVRPDIIVSRHRADAPGEAARSAEENGYGTIALDEAYRLYLEQKAIFVDARHAVDFDAGHIKGAQNLAIDQSETWLADFLAATDPATMIITYCDGENCHLAPELAELLFFNGFDNVYYIENGWTRWREKGYPVE
jgi:rhodanese-related sulfurtransferase